jgi:hypothetical protein
MQSCSSFCKVSFPFELATCLTEKLRLRIATAAAELHPTLLQQKVWFRSKKSRQICKGAKLSASLSSLPALQILTSTLWGKSCKR